MAEAVVNIDSPDLAEGRAHLTLGLIWRVIRRGLLAQVDIKLHPELYRLCEEGETVEDLRLTPDQILLRPPQAGRVESQVRCSAAA